MEFEYIINPTKDRGELIRRELALIIYELYHLAPDLKTDVLALKDLESRLHSVANDIIRFAEPVMNDPIIFACCERWNKARDSKNIQEMIDAMDSLLLETRKLGKNDLKVGKTEESKPQKSTSVTINGISIKDNCRTVAYADIERNFVPGSECWQIVYACSKSAFDGGPKQEWGETDVDALLNKLNELATGKKRSPRIRDDIHRLNNTINSKWSSANVKLLNIDPVTNLIILKPINTNSHAS